VGVLGADNSRSLRPFNAWKPGLELFKILQRFRLGFDSIKGGMVISAIALFLFSCLPEKRHFVLAKTVPPHSGLHL
jgi:hypothetical protein